LSFLLLDVDRFKQLNDEHGHTAGDAVLRKLAEVLKRTSRTMDMVARYGGEEFVVLMPDSGLSAAMLLLERMREHICQERFSSRHIAITFSAGVATLTPEDSDPINLLHRADEALRRAKNDGKNRVLSA
jgi:two-component system cell cycle response regulator